MRRAAPAWLAAGSLALGLLGSACASRTVPSADAGVTATSAPVVTDSRDRANAGLLDERRAREETDRILNEVARARNLEVSKTVKVSVIDREGIRAFSRQSLYEHATPEDLARTGRIDASLGILPVGADTEKVLLDLLEDGVLGLYDPEAKTLLIGDFVPTVMLSMVVGHEIVHALQDMHFDLQRIRAPIPHRSDEESARTFLIEGGAQAAYLAWVSGEAGLGSIDDAILDAMGDQTLDVTGEMSPYPILARSLQMPYADGTATVVRLVLSRGSWDAVDALYREPPTSTEQMLHLDKLLNREPPVPVTIEPEGLRGVLKLEPVWHDQLGEAALLSMLAEVAPSVLARAAAAGWGGDQLVAFDRPGEPLDAPAVVAAVAWDSESDAREFERGFAKYLTDVVATGTFIVRKGDVVVFGTHVPEGVDPDAVAAAVLESVRVERGRTSGRSGKGGTKGGSARRPSP